MSLKIEKFSIQYLQSELPILTNLDLEVNSGEFIIIVGKNGSGKSTLLRSIVKQFFPGSIQRVEGKIVNLSPSIRILQRVKSQILSFSVKEELGIKLAFNQISRETRKTKIRGIAEKFQLTNLLDKDPHLLSSGQLQLIVILASLIDIDSNTLILMDEPLSLLDQINTEILLNFLNELRNQGHSILLTFPYHPSINYATSILNLKDGKLTEALEPSKSYNFSPQIADNSAFFSMKGQVGYSNPLLDVDLTVPSNGIFLVTGPNGSGKSALLLTISGLIPQLSGEKNFESVFYLPQDVMSIFWRKKIGEEFRKKHSWLENFLESSPFIVSEGERKKLALQIAFDSEQNLALDEPTQSLDSNAIQWFLDQLEQTMFTRLIIIATNDSHLIDLIKSFSTHFSTEEL